MPISLQSIQDAAHKLGDKTNAQGFSPYMMPAALAGTGAGALLGYYASKNHMPGEDPGQRRRRILKNALMGLTLGGVAGGAIPAGVKTLTDPAGPMAGFHPIDSAANTAVRHWGPAAALAGGGAFSWHHLGKIREQAAENVANTLRPLEPGQRTLANGLNPMTDRIMAEARNPDSQKAVTGDLSKVLGGEWKARELLGEAGVRHFPSVAGDAAGESALGEHLAGQGPLARVMSRLVGKKLPASTPLGNYLPSGTQLAEAYSRYVRPSVSESLRSEGPRFGVPALAGLTGLGMLGGNYLQNKVEGN